MEINELLYGVANVFYKKDEILIEAIANEFELDVDEVRRVFRETCENNKWPPVKSQKRPAKKVGPSGKSNRKKSGYLFFAKEQRAEAKRMLMEDEDERTFVSSKGTTITVDPSEFGTKGEPSFKHITQKIASMWTLASDEDKKIYNQKALEYVPEEKPVKGRQAAKGKKVTKKPVKPVPKKKGQAATNSDDENTDSEEENISEEQSASVSDNEESNEDVSDASDEESSNESPKKPLSRKPITKPQGRQVQATRGRGGGTPRGRGNIRGRK